MRTFEKFTEEEVAKLKSFVTNTDKSIFVLTNLPEVIKGALFSRYSRSNLGLRRLLLEEFILNDDSSFDDIQGGAGTAHDSAVAIQKAQNFYQRILDGFGDDSIGELGGAHLAMENVSILASKEIEKLRIGGSPLEKSTRYVQFNEKVEGEYRFYKEPTIMASEHKDLYLKINNLLFDTYSKLIDPLKKFLSEKSPKPESYSEAAYNRALTAKVFDIIRGILPASTLTNVGVFGNGRFFEKLITNLRCSNLAEFREVGDSSFDELSSVIPSFVKRADKEHHTFDSNQRYRKASRELMKKLADAKLAKTEVQKTEAVTLVDYDKDAEDRLIADLLYPYSELPISQLREIAAEMSYEEKEKLIDESIANREHRRHKPARALENIFYNFDILADYGMYRDLQRHRMLTQEVQRLTTRYGYNCPDEIEEAGLADIYHDVMAQAAEAFETIQKDFPEEAQYLVPLCYNVRWYNNINMRSLSWLVELRSTPQGHENYRRIAQQMFKAVEKVHPLLAKYIRFVDLNEYPLGRIAAEDKKEKKK